jgi:hypothetical protein
VEWLGRAVVAITFGVMAGGLLVTGLSGVSFAAGCSSNGTATAFPDRSGGLDSTAQVSAAFNCGTLNVGAGDGSAWRLTGTDPDGRGPEVVSTSSAVSIEPGSTGSLSRRGHATWSLTIPRSPVIGFGVTLNAGQGAVDLTGASVSAATFTLNAGKLDMNLDAATQVGDVTGTVNAGSAAISLPGGQRDLTLSINAGALQLCLPSSAAVRVSWGGALGSNNFSAAGLTKVDDSTWTSAGFDAAQPHTELHANATAGSFDLRFGGSCRA